MATDAANIRSYAVNVLIAATGEDTAVPANWTDAGFCEQGTTKLTQDSANNITLHNGGEHQISGKFKFESKALETTAAQLTALEAFKAQTIDILLVRRDDATAGFKMTGMTLKVLPDYDFNLENVFKIGLEATVSAKNMGDFFSEETGLSGFTL
jgi:hypothetical protein